MTHKQDTDRGLCEAAKNAEWIAERQRKRAERAEAELAALRKRVDGAPTGTLLVNYSHGQPISANIAADDGEALAAIDCRSVRIMVEE